MFGAFRFLLDEFEELSVDSQLSTPVCLLSAESTRLAGDPHIGYRD